MPREHHYKRHKETPELDVTTFLNLMVVLIPFLLITAVFSRITIMELNLPTAAGGAAPDKPQVTIEVIVRKSALQIGNGRGVVASFPKIDGHYDLKRLSGYLQKLKNRYGQKDDATVLIEPDIEYEDMIHIMDAVRGAEIKQPGEDEIKKIELFPAISIGEAP